MKKSILYVTAMIMLLLGFIGYGLFGSTVFSLEGGRYYLKAGASKKTVLADLHNQGILPYPFFLTLYTYSQPSAVLKAGEYAFPMGSTPLSIWKQITTGKGLVYHPFTIIPGWSFHQLREALAKDPLLKHELITLDDKQLMMKLGQAETLPEGWFFPDTYYYTRGAADWTILKRALHLMQIKLQQAWVARASNLPYQQPYEALIAASLIEKEAYLAAERPIISGVLINRLRKGMLLQFDPTVIYGLGSHYQGKIYKQDLLEDTPYNTYLHKGLPPTPIAMPSFASIQAALHPEEHDYYYFVAKGGGAHQFSKALEEHHAAVFEGRNRTTYFNDTRVLQYLRPYFIRG